MNEFADPWLLYFTPLDNLAGIVHDGTGGARADLRLLPTADQAESRVAEDDAFRAAWLKVSRAAYGYEYPDGMELLTTVHFVAARQTAPADPDAIATEIARWSERKRQMFSSDDIRSAWRRLQETALLPTGG